MSRTTGENGNVLFFILIAVALLAALSFAMTQGNRDSGQDLSQERQRLLATEIIDYGDTIQKAVSTVRLRGIPFNAVRFSDPALSATYGVPGATPSAEIFNTAGGGVIYKNESTDAMANGAAQSYIFTASNEVDAIGTTCGTADCADLLILLPGLRADVCATINSLAGIPNANGAPPVDGPVDVTMFAGTATYAQTLGKTGAGVALSGKSVGCFQDSVQGYTYYQVLAAR